jgi:hypothetical protein
MTKIINFFSGPCSGKSTKAAELFSLMKKNNLNVELTYEFPKILAWEDNMSAIKDQFFITANQHRNITRLYGKVDYIIVDSPIILGCIYKNKYDDILSYPSSYYNKLNDFIIDLFKQYNNINIFLQRNEDNFNEVGRYQNLVESKIIDSEIKNLLLQNDISFFECIVDDNTVSVIYDRLIKN